MRRRFRFRLARALRAREIAECTARAQWAAAEGEAHAAEARVAELRGEADRALAATAARQASAEISPGSLLAGDRALDGFWRTLRAGRGRLERLRGAAEEKHRAWTERERDRRALERLGERQRELHRREELRAEDAELDEWASARRGRRPSSSGSPHPADEEPNWVAPGP